MLPTPNPPSTVRPQPRRRRRSRSSPPSPPAPSAIAGLAVAPAYASHPEVSLAGSNFEIDTDANLSVDDPAPSIDWANVTENRKADLRTGSGDDSFGQGSKEDTPVLASSTGASRPTRAT